jgi:methylated-DNA-[protein]-cysteine S-methyltransferase
MTDSIFYDTTASPIGTLLLTANEAGLTGVYLDGARYAPVAAAHWVHDRAPLREAVAQLAQYFAGERTRFDVALAPAGTPFQRRVWCALRDIPYGTTISYLELARRAGVHGAARAVGAANAHNPLSIVVPCHRVVGSDGSLTGYAGGLDRKRWLLQHEASSLRGAPAREQRLAAI